MPNPREIMTLSGHHCDPYDPSTLKFYIDEIATALSNKCRFSGHVKDYYSVAQHAVYVSLMVHDSLALWGLLHDAPEWIMADLPTPLKGDTTVRSDGISNVPWRSLEGWIMNRVCDWMGMDRREPAQVKFMDRQAYNFENALLRGRPWPTATPTVETPGFFRRHQFMAELPCNAKQMFLDRFHSLVEDNPWQYYSTYIEKPEAPIDKVAILSNN